MASADLTDPQSLNMYAYARDNSIDFTDPLGLYFLSNCGTTCWSTSVEILDDDDGAVALFSDIGSSGCVTTCNVGIPMVQPVSPPIEQGGGYGGGGLGQQDGKKYRGGKRNPIAQLADCLKLNVPGFGELQDAPRTLLENTFGIAAPIIYEGKFSTYQKAVFVNTVVAAAYVGADFSNAKFGGFYRADFNYENGIHVDGLGSKGTTRGRHRIGGFWDAASVEFEKGHIDVDLYHPNNVPFALLEFGGLAKQLREVGFNKKHRRGTHPGDVIKRLKDKAKINTGVSCER